jgi:Ca2+:H+ antiporter
MEKLNKIFYWLLIFVPISLFCGIFTDSTTLTFVTSVIAIIPLAAIIGFATREIAIQTNPTWGGLINATFGNIIELIIAVLALSKGLVTVVQASLIGSIIGNILLLIGLSIFVGGIRFKEQKFNTISAGISSTMLIIAVAGLAIPTIYSVTTHATADQIHVLSDAVAIVLAVIYIAGLLFALFTHKHLFDASDEIKALRKKSKLNIKKAVLILLIGIVFVALESEFLVKTVEHAAQSIGLTETFIGIIIIAIITNIAEKSTAIHFAIQNNLDISLEIGLSSAIQIALFVVPVLVFISTIFGYGFSLVFSVFEVAAVIFAVMIVNYLSSDGRCNWLEGAQLLSLYLIIAIVFFFI